MRGILLIATALFWILFNGCKPLYEINLPTQPTEATGDSLKLNGKAVFANQAKFVSAEAYLNIKEFTETRLVLANLKGIKAIGGQSKNGRVAQNTDIAAVTDITIIKVGDILVAGSFDKLKTGFLIEVTSVVRNGEEWVIEYVNAQLTQLFKDIDLSDVYTFSTPIPEITLSPEVSATSKSGVISKVPITLKANLDFRFTTGVAMRIKDSDLIYLSYRITRTKNTRLSIGTALNIEHSIYEPTPIPLGTIKCITRPFTTVVPPGIPIVINLTYRISAYFQPSLKAISFDVDLINSTEETTYRAYTEEATLPLKWKEISPPPIVSNETPSIKTAFEGSLQAGLLNEFNLSFYNLNSFDCAKSDQNKPLNGFTLKVDFFAKAEGICGEKGLDVKISGGRKTSLAIKVPFTKQELTVLEPDALNSVEDWYKTTVPGWVSCKDISIPQDPIIPTEVFNGGSSFGDPNIVTFDGKSYGFNGAGEFVALKSTTDNFEIQVRQEEIARRSNSGSVSWNTGLAINTGNDRLCFYPGKYFINGTQYAYNANITHTLPNGGNITGNTNTVTVNNTTGDIIKVFNLGDMINYSVIPANQRQGKLIGIFGDYDKNFNNDLKLRNGTPVDGSYTSLYPVFTDSWRIAQAQSLFVYDTGKNTTSYTDRNFPRSPLAISADQRASAEQTCKNAGVVVPYLEGCINDVVATGDVNAAKWAKDLQEETVLRSFDIKFGEKEDKSLLIDPFKSNKYGSNFLILETLSYPNILKPMSIQRGFETTIYLASEGKIERNQSSYSATELRINFGYFSFMISEDGNGKRNVIDGLSYSKSIGANVPLFFDGNTHKIKIKYIFDLDQNRVVRTIAIDDIYVLNNDSSTFNFSLDLNGFRNKSSIGLDMRTYEGFLTKNPSGKLYRWSFKSL